MSQIKVKPAEGRKVRSAEHDNEHLPEDGGWVTHNEYWARRINDGDVTVIDAAEVDPELPTRRRHIAQTKAS